MRYLKALVFFLFFVQHSIGQTYTIKGSVKDTLNYRSLPLSSAVLFNAKDSVIVTFARADTGGNFSLNVDKPGKYIVRITFPGFADYVDGINISRPVTDLGQVPMITKEHLLKEFVLTKQISAIKIKGDTTEYVADSFKVKDNANVEDLLKRLPGIEVDKDGKITAQGETVQKILVDGEEFFSDDPKVVTKGLEANIVDKVQVYDKKSDQAEFTGVDDGQKTKTINLQLKEDKKKGYFGKIDAGAGTDGYYQEQGMLNAFKGKRQLSVFGIMSNTDKVGLGWQDNNKFGSSSDMITDENGNTYMTSDNNDDNTNWDGSYSGEGFPKVWTGGAHYADKWNEDKDHATGNYRYGKQQVDVDANNITQYALAGDTSNVSNVRQTQFSNSEKHAIDGLFEVKIDSNNSVKVTASAGHKESQAMSHYFTTTSLHTSEADDTLYTNDRRIANNTTSDFLNADALFKKKFAKKGRTLSVDVKENYKNSISNGSLYSIIVPDSTNPKDSIIDQAKVNDVTALVLAAKATYTEPITKVLNMELDYGATVNNTTSKSYSYNHDSNTGKYDLLDSLYSSDYQYNILSNTGGVNFRWVYKKINFAVGTDVSTTHYGQKDLVYDTSYQYNYLSFAPKASFRYKVSNQKSISFNYYGNTQQPTITQIQPLRQNADPTNIVIGNPNLKQAFNNRVNIHYNSYKVLTGQWIYAEADMRYSNNPISTSIINRDGINTTQYINVNNSYGASSWVGMGFKLKKPDLQIGGHLNPSVSQSINYINGEKNLNTNNSYDVGLDFSMYKEDKFDFAFRPSITYYDNRATVSNYSTNYWQSNSQLSGSVQITKKFEVGSDVNFMFRERTPAFPTNNNVIKWNAYVSRKLLKKDQLELRLSVFDILNQNIGYARTAQANIITQNSYNTIRRYGMINVIWNFTHRPGTTTETTTEEAK